MEPFTIHSGVVAPLDRANVDTDQIIPKQYLKVVDRAGLGSALFSSWRYLADGTPDPAFVLNQPRYEKATILVAGPNFGSGSSREHAVWALQDHGFRVVLAPSFADIFYNNCFKNGVLPLILPHTQIDELTRRAVINGGYHLTVDLLNCRVFDYIGFEQPFQIDPFRRTCLVEGLDDIALTLLHTDNIAAFEATRQVW